MNRLPIAVLSASLMVLATARGQTPSFNYIETRQAGQDLLSGTFVGIVQGARQNAPVKAFANPAAALARWMRQFPSTFPEGTDKGPTHALPSVWSDRTAFLQAAANFVATATKLSDLARASDKDGFDAQIKVVGDACTACHDKFRAK